MGSYISFIYIFVTSSKLNAKKSNKLMFQRFKVYILSGTLRVFMTQQILYYFGPESAWSYIKLFYIVLEISSRRLETKHKQKMTVFGQK